MTHSGRIPAVLLTAFSAVAFKAAVPSPRFGGDDVPASPYQTTLDLPMGDNTPVADVLATPPSSADLSRLINEGLKGKDRATDPIYQQIMYSALDLGSDYQVSIAAWGQNPSPMAKVLQSAQITDFSLKKSKRRWCFSDCPCK